MSRGPRSWRTAPSHQTMSDPANKSVFLSYVSQDAEAARRIADALRAVGVAVWFDADGGLAPGDESDAKIRRQIKECVLFIPVISASTQARQEGYFRTAWELAAERAMGVATGEVFILPIIIDDTREPDALVPDRFRKVQWTQLSGGTMTPEVQARFQKLWAHRMGALAHEAKRATEPGGGAPIQPGSGSGRRLAAIVFTDVVGYSARMQRDEKSTMALVEADFALMRERCAQHGGEVLNTMGDGLLLCFPSAVQAVTCALQIQSEFGQRCGTLPPEQALEHRIGVHIGDVFRQETGGLAGDGVNIAARLEGKAPAGGICISQMVHDTVKGKVPMQAVFIGPESFKNITEPIPIWNIAPLGAATLSCPPVPLALRLVRSGGWRRVAGFFAVVGITALAGWLWSHREVARPATPSLEVNDKSIAVLPFVDMSQTRDQEYFSDGLAEELLNQLVRIPQLRVIARTSSFSFKGKDVPIATIARTLNVTAVLEGSVRKSGSMLRITAQLIRASDSSHLWSETYDRQLTDVFKVQDEIAGAVVSALKLKLLPDQRPASVRRFVPSPEAYDQFLLGRQLTNRNTQAGYDGAIEAFHHALVLEPNYANAYAALSLAEKSASFLAVSTAGFASGQQRALAAAEKAIALDPLLADGYAARAAVRIESWDWAGAQADLDKARALNPESVLAYACIACFFATRGQLPEAIAAVSAAIEINPMSIEELIKLARFKIAIDDLPAARKALDRALSIAPKSGSMISYYLGLVSLLDGHPEAASAEAAKLTNEPFRLELLAVAEFDLGHAAASQQALDALIQKCSEDAPYQIAEVYAWREEHDHAAIWLERAYQQHDRQLRFLKFNPLLRKLHNDPRYSALLRKMRLPE